MSWYYLYKMWFTPLIVISATLSFLIQVSEITHPLKVHHVPYPSLHSSACCLLTTRPPPSFPDQEPIWSENSSHTMMNRGPQPEKKLAHARAPSAESVLQSPAWSQLKLFLMLCWFSEPERLVRNAASPWRSLYYALLLIDFICFDKILFCGPSSKRPLRLSAFPHS